jgi:hypothetical protein
MFQTVNVGKVSFEDLANRLYNVVPTAQALGISFGECRSGNRRDDGTGRARIGRDDTTPADVRRTLKRGRQDLDPVQRVVGEIVP